MFEPTRSYPIIVSLSQLPQWPPGDTCQVCQRASSEPTEKASSRPSSFSATNGSPRALTELDGVPRVPQLPQAPPDVSCQICHSSPSEPIVNTSRRPSLFFLTEGAERLPVVGLPNEAQLLQVPLGAVCQICQSVAVALVPKGSSTVSIMTKTSRRPSSFFLTKGW